MPEPATRSISVWQGTALYVGAVVGSGILILPGITASIAGAGALLAWAGMILLSLPLASTFAYLARDYPSAGGVSTFVERAFGRYPGALIGWFYFIAATAGQFIVPLTGGVYVSYVFHWPRGAAFGIATVILAGAIASNYRGIRTSGKVQLVTSGLIAVVLLAAMAAAVPAMHSGAWVPHGAGLRWSDVGRSSMLIFWSFFGWEAIASLAPEFRHPQRDVLRATWGGVVIVGVLYLGIALAVIGTHAYVAAPPSSSVPVNNAALARVMGMAIGQSGAVVTALLAVVICLGTTNAFVAGISRLAYALAHRGSAPRWLDRVDARGTPQRAVLLVASMAGTGILVTWVCHLSMTRLVYIPNSLGIATYILGTAAGVRLIRTLQGKIAAGISCAACIAAYPFVGTFIGIPAVVTVCCIGYLVWRGRWQGRERMPRFNEMG